MEDAQILALFWARAEDAIPETHAVYGRRLFGISNRILHCSEDAQECVSDTYLRAWNTIPPQRPVYFFAYLAKICRNLSLTRLEWNTAAKRCATVVELTREMELCIPDPAARYTGQELGQLLNTFLEGLPRESRLIFLRRYWYADSIQAIAQRYGITQSKVKTRLHRTRRQLKQYLEGEGITI